VVNFLRGKQKLVVGILLVVLANALGAYLLTADRLHDAQTYVNDSIMRTSAQVPDPRIMVVAIDDQSLKDYGRLGNWDRANYGKLIAFLKDAGARVVLLEAPARVARARPA